MGPDAHGDPAPTEGGIVDPKRLLTSNSFWLAAVNFLWLYLVQLTPLTTDHPRWAIALFMVVNALAVVYKLLEGKMPTPAVVTRWKRQFKRKQP